MRLHDSLFGLLFIALGGAVLYTVAGYPKMPGQDVGPNMFPGIAGALLAVFGLVLAVRGKLRPAASRALVALGPWAGSPMHILALASVILGCIAYIAFAHVVGFLVLMPLLLFVWHFTFGVTLGRALISAALTSAIAWGLFYKLLGVPLPWGLLKNHAF